MKISSACTKILMLLIFSFSYKGLWAEQFNSSYRSFQDDRDQSDAEHDPYYFVHAFQQREARFIGGCGKGSQRLNSKTAYLRIQHPILKKEIKSKFTRHEEFTAMSFLINGKKEYLTILDEDFIHRYCRLSGDQAIPVTLDGYQVDIQFEQRYQQEIVIEKVNIKSQMRH